MRSISHNNNNLIKGSSISVDNKFLLGEAVVVDNTDSLSATKTVESMTVP